MSTPNDLNKNAHAYNESISQSLQEIVRPLYNAFGFNHFTYTKYIQGERYMLLCADTSSTKEYFTLDLDKSLHVFKNLILPKYTKKVIVWDLEKENDLLDLLKKQGYYHGVSIFFRHDDVIEGWHFATNQDNAEINDLYVNNLSVIDRFIAYFQDKGRYLIDSSDENRLAIYQNKGRLDFSKTVDLCPKDYPGHPEFYKIIKPKKFIFYGENDIVYLSSMEFFCLKGVSEGLTAKEIGLIHEISFRTVEAYIQNIKNKFKVDSKAQLVSAFRKSPYGTCLLPTSNFSRSWI